MANSEDVVVGKKLLNMSIEENAKRVTRNMIRKQ